MELHQGTQGETVGEGMATIALTGLPTTDFVPDSGLPPAILSLLYFPGGRASGTKLPDILGQIQRAVAPQIELAIATFAENDPDGMQQQVACGIEDRPAIVVARHQPGEGSPGSVDPGQWLAYAVLGDQPIWDDPARLTEMVTNLVRVFAASTPREMEAALVNRRCRMWVWQAAARSGASLDYFTDVQLSFGVGAFHLSLSFDEDGWSHDNLSHAE
jgi:hypothetical protein